MPKGRCPVVLEEGATEKVCLDLKERRRLTLCRSWEIIAGGEEREFGKALRQAWKETKTRCAQLEKA